MYQRNRAIHLEDSSPETFPIRETFEEILYFYQPAEDLTLEDAIRDVTVPWPKQEDELNELHRCPQVALARLPRRWRRALVLCHVNGLEGPLLAQAVQISAPDAERGLQYAREYLRQPLLEAGCALKDDTRRAAAV